MKLSSTAGMQGIGWAQETFVGKSGEASATISKGHIVQCTLTALEPDDDQEVKLATGAITGIYGVALETITAGNRGLICLSGKVECMGGDTSAAGTPIMPQSGGEAIAHAGDATVSVGFAVDALTNAALHTVIFDGFAPQRTGDFAA